VYGALTSSIFAVIPSYPCEFFTLIDLIILPISLVDVLLHFILGKGLCDILDK
jgi:hypothetical protein